MRLPGMRHVYTRLLFFLLLLLVTVPARSQDDAAVLLDLKNSLNNPPATWTGSDPCEWGSGIQCQNARVTRIQIGSKNLAGTLPASLVNLTELTVLEAMNNNLTGALPSLSGLANLQTLNLHSNSFTSVPPDFFSGMTSLSSVNLDYNPFGPWTLPKEIVDATALREFSANGANLVGPVPDIFSAKNFPGLQSLHLAMNGLTGGLPGSLAGSSIQSLWLNGQNLNGSVTVIGNMTSLTELWLNKNSFTGGLPDFSSLTGLQNLTLRDNLLTGPVPASLVSLDSLFIVNLTNNLLQGPTPKFSSRVSLDLTGTNKFCTATPGGQCSDIVNVLLEIAGGFLYPRILANNWPGNDPCIVGNQWKGITCVGSNVTVINFRNFGLTGSISPSFSKIPSLQKILLANNAISGAIPDSLTGLSSLVELDVSNNNLHGPVPDFQKNVLFNVDGNVDINKTTSSTTPSGSPGTSGGSGGSGGRDDGGSSSGASGGKSSSKAKVVVPVIAVAFSVCIVGLGLLYFRRKRKRSGKVQSPSMVVIHPHNSDDGVKITISEGSTTGATGTSSYTTGASSDMHVVEAGSMVISIQVLREVTNNFSEANILGKGGFGTVYKGELHDGTKIAVKRMESGSVSEKGLTEFRAEIDVLNKVRHRHLVTLHGYCLDGNEKLLVYEYMPQGTLSRYLFHWEEENIKPLAWSRRLIIALDVARGVEYLHGLAQQTFIHRDLKPSNILLDDNMRAKVADFGLVRLAPEGGKASIATRIAGTFGYLAPEYAVTGRVTTKIDVFSFGVILMELISGRKALDENRPEDSLHLVTWFRRKSIEKDTFRDAIDPTIELNEEILASVLKVAELAGHCTAREPYQRPDMGHVVNVLSSLVELWKPTETEDEDIFAAIDYGMTLRQTVKMWKDSESSNSGYSFSSSLLPGSSDNTQTSIPNRPTGFAESFQSADAR